MYIKRTHVKIHFLLFLSIKKLKISSTIYKIGVEFSQLSIGIICFLICFTIFEKNAKNERNNKNGILCTKS